MVEHLQIFAKAFESKDVDFRFIHLNLKNTRRLSEMCQNANDWRDNSKFSKSKACDPRKRGTCEMRKEQYLANIQKVL